MSMPRCSKICSPALIDRKAWPNVMRILAVARSSIKQNTVASKTGRPVSARTKVGSRSPELHRTVLIRKAAKLLPRFKGEL